MHCCVVFMLLCEQVQFRQENPIQWSEIDGPYTRTGGGVKTAGLPVAFTDPLRRRDAKQFVLALGIYYWLSCTVLNAVIVYIIYFCM
jgi:hypothetical protein